MIDARTSGRTEPGLSVYLVDALSETLFGAVLVCAGVVAVLGQSTSAEHLGYILMGLAVVPVSFAVAWRRRASATVDADQRSLAAVLRFALTAAGLCVVRVVQLGHASLLLLLLLLAARAVTPAVVRIATRRGWGRLPIRVMVSTTSVWLLIAALPFVPPSALTLGNVVLAGVCSGAFCGLMAWQVVASRVGRGVVDAVTVVVCTLVVFYVGPLTLVLALNQNYLLGPANDVLHGHPMLVSTFSQYGVGLIDAIAAFNKVVPIGYGTFTLLLSALTAGLFATIYAVLRLSIRSQMIAIAGLAVAVTLDIFGQLGSYTYYPSTGVLRFGLPWLVILLSVAGARAEHRPRLFDHLLLITIAVAALWSGETVVYCLGTAAAIACLRAVTYEGSWGARLRAAVAEIARLVGASVAGVLLFTVATRVATGVWPDWGGYLNFIGLYTVANFGAIPIAAWSPGLALGALYAGSAVMIVAIAVARPSVVRDHRAAFHAAAGLTAFGALVFTYFLGRAAPNNLIHVSGPAIALGFVWLGVMRATVFDHRSIAVVTAVAIFTGSLVVVAEHRNVQRKYRVTALAALLGHTPGMTIELRSLARNPVVEPEAAHIAAFVSSLRPRQGAITIVLYPSVESEALLRLDRANAVGTSNPCQESLTALGTVRVAKSVRALRSGGILVTSSAAADAGTLLSIQHYELELIRSRFTLRRIGADGRGLDAYVMSARAATGLRAPLAPVPGPLRLGCG